MNLENCDLCSATSYSEQLLKENIYIRSASFGFYLVYDIDTISYLLAKFEYRTNLKYKLMSRTLWIALVLGFFILSSCN